jgi:hypothetical protein
VPSIPIFHASWLDTRHEIHYFNWEHYRIKYLPGQWGQREEFMADVKVYECANCGNTVEVSGDESKAPECCGAAMKTAEELKACGLSSTAEHSRFDDFDEPCDDGRSGKI